MVANQVSLDYNTKRDQLTVSRLRAEVPLEVAVSTDTHAIFFVSFDATANRAC
jgi:hypothetical protein